MKKDLETLVVHPHQKFTKYQVQKRQSNFMHYNPRQYILWSLYDKRSYEWTADKE